MDELATEVRFLPAGNADLVATTLGLISSVEVISGEPVRLPPSYKGQRNFPGLFWLATTRKTVVYESLLELDRLWLADFDPQTVRIATQPFHLQRTRRAHEKNHSFRFSPTAISA